jgi:hypothetical protein
MKGDGGCGIASRRVIAVVAVVILVVGSAPLVAAGVDWSTILRPATLAFFQLGNPYHTIGSLGPPWLFVLLAPLAVLPPALGAIAIFWLNLGTWVFVTKKLGAGGLLNLLAVVTSPMVINGLLARNVDFLVMWGLLLPPEVAVYFLALKPQVGAGAMAYLALTVYRTRGFRGLLRVFLLPCLVSVLTFVAYGLKASDARETLGMPWNASPVILLGWPSLLIGVILFVCAIMSHSPGDGARISMAATPFFCPYVGTQSWISCLPALMKSKALYVMWGIAWAWIIYVLAR